MNMKILKDRLLSAFFVPIGVTLVTGLIIVAVGELLLAMAEAKHHSFIGGIEIREPYAVLVALLLAIVALVGAAYFAKNKRNSG